MVVCSGLTTATAATAAWTAPALVGLAAAGVLATPRGRPRPELAPVFGVMAVVLALFGAPVILSGEPTFTGYVKLDDTATFLALTDHALEHGRDLGGLAPSSYEATLADYLANGYPLGALTPLGATARLVGTDPAWVWQPYIAFAAALLASVLFGLARPLVSSAPLRAGVAVLAAQPALLYGYALWGGAKEVLAAALLALGAATVPYVTGGIAPGVRHLLVPATAAAAFLATMSLGGLVWLAPLGVGAIAWCTRARTVRTAVLAVATGLLALPTLLSAPEFLRDDNVTTLRAEDELGNLVRPLRLRQALGVWPTGDFRLDPSSQGEAWALVGVAAAAVCVGIVVAVSRRALVILLLLASAIGSAALVVALGSPWVGGKALAIVSPIVLFVAACGCAALLTSRRPAVGAVLAGVLVAGVSWSNVLAYRAAWLAPYEQLTELERIGERFAGRGPALMTEYQPYGVRHFLRRLDAEGASELRRRPIPLRSGRLLGKGEFADLDEFSLPALLEYRTLVLRRSPVASRPPSAYRLVHTGRWYEVWERSDQTTVVERLSLSSGLDPLGAVPCAEIDRLAGSATSSGGYLVTPVSRSPVVAAIAGTLPAGWSSLGTTGSVVPSVNGTVEIPLETLVRARYGVWVGGSHRGVLRAMVDGRAAGRATGHLNPGGQWTRLGAIDLAPGAHVFSLELDRGGLGPGEAGEPFALGPVALQIEAADSLRRIEPGGARALCGRRLDWVEVARTRET